MKARTLNVALKDLMGVHALVLYLQSLFIYFDSNVIRMKVHPLPGEPAQKDKLLSNDEKLCKSGIYTAFFISTKSSERQEKANFSHVMVTIWLQKNSCNFL